LSHKIRDIQEHEEEIIKYWNTTPQLDKRTWLLNHNFRFADDFSKRPWEELNKTIRVRWRIGFLQNLSIKNRHKKRKK